MPRWEFNAATGKGTLYMNGGPIIEQRTVNGNTVNLDGTGEIASIVFPNPAGTMNMAGIPFKGKDGEVAREYMKNFHHFKTAGN